MPDLVLGIDTGGTYTDGVILEQNTRKILKTAKTLTTKPNLANGILATLDTLLPDNLQDIKLVAISTTLATNAIAEGNRRPVGLFLIGYDQGLIEKFNLGSEFATSHFHYVQGGHNLYGHPQAPLDLDFLIEKATTLKDQVEAFAISGYFSPFNSNHEERAFQAITKATNRPVVLGHELASKLNSIERATTATLNASLLSPLRSFINAMEQSLRERGVNAPLMVVRGDGALVSGELAKDRPVETVHSGPAASAIGGRFLSQTDHAVVVDIGGTTTDIAILENGQVTIREEGTSVGKYNTAVRAAHIHSLGLGGDSRITLSVEDQIIIGPERVTPISYLAHSNAAVAKDLKKLSVHRQKPFSLQNLEYWYLLREPSPAMRNSRTRDVLNLLEKGPMAIPDILEKLDVFHPVQFEGVALLREEIIGRSGLTPTDLLHVTGEF
ncbi:MAG: hydantoinase/oxoprolinase family protein, partial [Chloroflexota bacterium]|nr:hydantoinase/oxoprolinase family protein [Chloroflexota bacterium]